MSESEQHKSERSSSGAGTTSTSGEVTPITRWPWQAQLFFAVVIIVAIVVLLVGLPTASMLVAKKMSSGSELSGTVSFWGALFAAFISLVVTFIAGVFAFTAFKVEGNAAQEARKTAREETHHTVKQEIQNKMIELVGKYLEEKDPDGGGENACTRGQMAARLAADNYANNHGEEIIRCVADKYVDKNGERITAKEALNFVNNNGERIAGTVAANYFSENGKRITEDAVGSFLNDNGERLTMERVDNYIRETVDGEEMSRGEKVARQAVDEYVGNVVDDYVGKDIEDEKVTRIEKMSKELVENFHAKEIAGLVDERLASLGFADMIRLRFMRRRPHNEPDSVDNKRQR